MITALSLGALLMIGNAVDTRLTLEPIACGDIDRVRSMIDAGADPNLDVILEQDIGVEPHLPLHIAAAHGQEEMARYLFSRGARDRIDPTTRNHTAAREAIERGHWELALWLLDADPAPPQEYLGHVFKAAVDDARHTNDWRSKTDLRRILAERSLRRGLDPNGRAVRVEVYRAAAYGNFGEEASRRLRAQWAQRDSELAERSRRNANLKVAIKVGAWVAWGGYLGASIAAYRRPDPTLGRAGHDVNLWMGPLLGGVGAGAAAGLTLPDAFSFGEHGLGRLALPFLVGIPVAFATTATLAALNHAHRSDLSAHPVLYFAGPVLSVAFPMTVSVLLR